MRVIPFSETSRIVTWFTPQYGKITTILKGAMRRNSLFQGQYDWYCESELLFYPRWHSGLHIAGECFLLQSRPFLRSNWRAAAIAAYLTDLVYNWIPLHAPSLYLFNLLTQAVATLDQSLFAENLLSWFELRLLKIAGIQPGLTKCQICQCSFFMDNSLEAQKGECFFSASAGGVLCKKCHAARSLPDSSLMPLDILAILNYWQVTDDWKIAKRMHCSLRQRKIIQDLLGFFLFCHLDLPQRARQTAFNIITDGAGEC